MNLEDKQMLLDLSKDFIKEKANEMINETEKITLSKNKEELSVIFENIEVKLEELKHKVNQLKSLMNDK